VSNKRVLICGCVAAILLILSPWPAWADEYWSLSPAQSGDWSVPGNWGGGAVPTSSDTAYIVNGGTAGVASIGPVCGTLSLGGTAGSGSLQMTGGSLYAASHEYVGNSGTGTFTQSGGTNTLTFFTLGNNANGNGTYSLNDSGVLSTGWVTVGNYGTGTFTQTGGNNTPSFVYIGNYAHSSGTYSLSGTGQFSA
jgi:hypothetical protein